MTELEAFAAETGYALISVVLGAALVYAIVRWRPVYIAAKIAFLIVWGAVSLIAPVYHYLAISIPHGEPVFGAFVALLYLILIGGPFVYFGLPKLLAAVGPR